MLIDVLVRSSTFSNDRPQMIDIIVTETKSSPEISIRKMNRQSPGIVFELQILTQRDHSLNELWRRRPQSRPRDSSMNILRSSSKSGRRHSSSR